MPQVDFYILADVKAPAQQLHACRLAEQAFDQGQKVYLRVATEQQVQQLDELLWTFSDRVFLPHEIAGPASPSHPLIAALIGRETAPEGFRSLLVNMTDEMPADADQFERIAEVVAADPERKQRARDRFRLYRERGWPLASHNV